ncbi:MAG TPA: Maf family protein [Anaeromyxobacteraceae bacterium]|nr:Maf family protein [Anaeromyxobacteraceae bacterium]
MTLTLASRSPRRFELLAQLGVPLEVTPADTDETPREGEYALDYVRRVAREKAFSVSGETVLGADTAVVLEGAILGKPEGPDHAARMLRALSSQAHEVLTGVCARRGEREETLAVRSVVRFSPLSEAQIAWYVATGEPLDKAGAYAIQGRGGAFVVGVEGSISNVVGLPLVETLGLLGRLGFAFPWAGEK